MPVRQTAASLPDPDQQGLPVPTLRLLVLLNLVQQSRARSAVAEDLKDPRTSNLGLPSLVGEAAEVEVEVVAVDKEAEAYLAAAMVAVVMIDSALHLGDLRPAERFNPQHICSTRSMGAIPFRVSSFW